MSIKEKCGILAFIPKRQGASDYNYMLVDCDKDEKSEVKELISRYNNFASANEIKLIYAFAKSLKRLNHRGYDGYGYSMLSESGLISEVFSDKVSCKLLVDSIISRLLRGRSLDTNRTKNPNNISIYYLIGHVRYSTNDSYNILDNQPYQMKLDSSDVGICFNGNIETDTSNFEKYDLENKSDDLHNLECIYMLKQFYKIKSENLNCDINHSSSMIKLCKSIKNVTNGAFSTLLYSDKYLCAFKDNKGTRPLLNMQSEDLEIITSESVAIANSSDFKCNFIASNEIYEFEIENRTLERKIYLYEEDTCERLCSFETIYFSSGDSKEKHDLISSSRNRLGQILARKEKLFIDENDIVSYIPKSASSYADGYSLLIGRKLDEIIKKSPAYERSFIKKMKNIESTLEDKFIIDTSNLKDRRVILIDDSLVRGSTIKYLSSKLRVHGVKEIHIRIASPMIKSGCHLGVNTRNENLICRNVSKENLCEELDVDSITFLEKEELFSVLGNEKCKLCFENI